MFLAWWMSCAWLVGLEELEALPPGFPLDVAAETGKITAPPEGGQVAVDAVFETADAARAGFQTLITQATERGFAERDRAVVDKRDQVVLEGPSGRVTLGCCPVRADRRHLVFVTWEESP